MSEARVLVACERSQVVCKAFRRRGHLAFSCDTEPCSGGKPAWHIQDKLENVIGDGTAWSMILAFPPCTYVCSSGLFRNKNNPERQAKTEAALEFIQMILNRKCKKIALENPVGCIGTRIRPASQYIQPNQFGHDASKKTGLWLKGLPPLWPTKKINGRWVFYKGRMVERWANQTDSGQNRLAPSPDRARIRSETYYGIGEAMADQWGSLLP